MSDEITNDVAAKMTTGAETFQKKTEDYGDSWRKIGEILLSMSHGEPITLETKEDFVSFGLFTRRLDKFARAFHGEFAAEDMNFESVQDAHEDEGVYAFMHAVNQGHRQDDSAEETMPDIADSHTTQDEMPSSNEADGSHNTRVINALGDE